MRQARNLFCFLLGLLLPLLFVIPSHAIDCNGQSFPQATDCDSCIVKLQGYQWTYSGAASSAFTSFDGTANQLISKGNYWTSLGGGPTMNLYNTALLRNEKYTLDPAFYQYVPCNPPPGGGDPDPDHCTNLVMDEDEVGKDCGGSCSAVCVNKCPEGTDYIFQLGDPALGFAGNCIKTAAADIYGNCPLGYEKAEDGTCESWVTATLVPDESPIGAEGEHMPGWSTDPTVTLETSEVQDGPPSDPDAPPGTQSTVVKTTTTTNNNTTTTTTKTTYYSGSGGTGDVLGEKTVEESQPGDNEGDYDYSLGNVKDNTYDAEIAPEDLPTEEDVPGLLNTWIQSSPFATAFDSVEVQTSLASCSASLGTVFGVELDADLCRWQTQLEIFGNILFSMGGIFSVLIIWRGWK